ncbi:MAG TPA: Gfo/Idh/MocA family oxidoreductase [Clostridiales bacterium]|nr:Gfo/Idh/MocA family oxidoreductase [Clostridiales bacterium]
MEKIRMGVIGCGGMAKSHLLGLLELSDKMVVTAVCDIVPERVQEAAKVIGAEIAVTDYREMVNNVDAVLISLPHDLHFETGMFFLKAGKHVLMEKPMCNTEEECIKLIETAEKYKKVLMTAYPVRYWPIILKMKELVDAKTYGEAFQMSIWTEQFTKYPEGHWALSAKRLGGGQFFSHGCHYIDLLLWFLGKPVKGFHMGTNFGTPWMENEGTSNAVIEFENGAMGYHFGTWGARGTRLGYSFHIHCTEGMLEYSKADGQGKLYLHSHIKGEKANLDTTSRTQVLMVETDQSKKTQFETLHFLNCIQNDTRPFTDGPASLQGLRIIWRMYEAETKNIIADLNGLGLDEDWRNVK